MRRAGVLPGLLAVLAAVPAARGQVLPVPVLSAIVAPLPGPTAHALVDRDEPGGDALGAFVLGAIGFAGVAFCDPQDGIFPVPVAQVVAAVLAGTATARGRGT